MNILGFTEPTKLLEALLKGSIEFLDDFYGEIGDEEVFSKELENEFCNPCNEKQCNYCSVYAIQTKYLE